MRVCFYVLLFSFRQLSQQLQLTAVIKADAADGDLPFTVFRSLRSKRTVSGLNWLRLNSFSNCYCPAGPKSGNR